jgi:hypothetical protein
MAWFTNHYVCPECRAVWESDWSCATDDECPECEVRDISPTSTDDRTVLAEPASDGSWTIWQSSRLADDSPRYGVVGRLTPGTSGTLTFVAQARAK